MFKKMIAIFAIGAGVLFFSQEDAPLKIKTTLTSWVDLKVKPSMEKSSAPTSTEIKKKDPIMDSDLSPKAKLELVARQVAEMEKEMNMAKIVEKMNDAKTTETEREELVVKMNTYSQKIVDQTRLEIELIQKEAL